MTRPDRRLHDQAALAMAVLVAVTAALAMPGRACPTDERIFACTVSEFSAYEVVARVAGVCGATCGHLVKWVLFYDQEGAPRLPYDRGLSTAPDGETWLQPTRGVPSLAVATLFTTARRDAAGNPVQLGEPCGYRFQWDGSVHHLELRR